MEKLKLALFMVKRICCFLVLTGFLIIIFSCEKPKSPTVEPSSIEFEITHTWKGAPINLSKEYYLTNSGDSLLISTLIYHLNSFFIGLSNGEKISFDHYKMPDEEFPESKKFQLDFSSTNQISSFGFSLGVEDSLTNKMGLLNNQFLNPMYWSMLQGYINFKIEGKSPNSDNGSLIWHIGGYTKGYKSAKKVVLPIPQGFSIEPGQHKKLNLIMDLSMLFSQPNTVKIKEVNNIKVPGEKAVTVSGNFLYLFSLRE